MKLCLVRLLLISAAPIALASGVAAAANHPPRSTGFTDLYNFCSQASCTDGENAISGLVADRSGNLYGTTEYGGADSGGLVYRVSPGGTETVLYNFCSQGGSSCTDGQYPQGGTLARDRKGNIYGTTENGGANGAGTVFKLAPDGSETILYSFCAQASCTDGGFPVAGVVLDAAGNIYGSTGYYGANGSGGTLFKLTASGSYSVLYSFCAQANCADGNSPDGNPLRDSSGNLFGVTYSGGTGSGNGGSNNGGVLWELTANGTYSVLYDFCSFVNNGTCMDSQTPIGTVAEDASGNLYGTAYFGGVNAGGCGEAGCGTVWEFTPPHEYLALHTFCTSGTCNDGSHPSAGVILKNGNAFGTAQCGGGGSTCGDVFSVGTGTLNARFKVLHGFGSAGDNSACCVDSPVILFKGWLYGTTFFGGSGNNGGIVFKLGTAGGSARRSKVQ